MLRVDPDGAGFSAAWLGARKIVLPKSPLLLEHSASSHLPGVSGSASVLALPHPHTFAAMRVSEENCAAGTLGSWDGFLPCPSLLSCQAPTAGSPLHVGLDASLFHAACAGAALIEAVNQLASVVEINDGCNVN